MIGNFPAVFNFNRLFLKLNKFVCNKLPVLADHREEVDDLHLLTINGMGFVYFPYTAQNLNVILHDHGARIENHNKPHTLYSSCSCSRTTFST